MVDNGIHIAAAMREQARELEAEACELRQRAELLDPPCGEWMDGHSYRKCDRPRSQCTVHNRAARAAGGQA